MPVTRIVPSINKTISLHALLAGCALLSGCVSMQGIEPNAKATPVNSLQAGSTISTAPKIEWPAQDWWKAYQDPQLDALVATAVAGSPSLRMAKARAALAQAFADSAHAETLPNVGADASIVRERFTALQFIPPPWGGHTDWNNKVTTSLAYDLDLWGRQESIWHASVDDARAAAIEVQQVKLELATTVVRHYVQLAMEFTLRDIAEEHLQQLEQREAIARRGLAAGIGTEMDLAEAETPLPLARAHIEAINTRIGLLRNQLAALSGQGPGAGETIKRPGMSLNAGIGLPDQLPANLIGRRPDVLAYRWRVEATRQNIEGAKAAFYPNINLLAFVGLQALGFGQLISSAANIAGVGPALSLPIFDGGRRRGNLSAKTALHDMAVENYNEVLVRALQDVSDHLLVLQSNARQRTEAEHALETAHKAHELALSAYHAGLSNYQHVLDTHSVVLRQQENIAQLHAMRLDAHAGLMRALGGGALDSAEIKAVVLP